MAEYILSNKADSDLTEIYKYSHRTFGEATADAYFQSLATCLQSLAASPRLGRHTHLSIPNLLRHEHEQHIIFYQIEADGIFIIRILHRGMDAINHIDQDFERN